MLHQPQFLGPGDYTENLLAMFKAAAVVIMIPCCLSNAKYTALLSSHIRINQATRSTSTVVTYSVLSL